MERDHDESAQSSVDEDGNNEETTGKAFDIGENIRQPAEEFFHRSGGEHLSCFL